MIDQSISSGKLPPESKQLAANTAGLIQNESELNDDRLAPIPKKETKERSVSVASKSRSISEKAESKSVFFPFR